MLRKNWKREGILKLKIKEIEFSMCRGIDTAVIPEVFLREAFMKNAICILEKARTEGN